MTSQDSGTAAISIIIPVYNGGEHFRACLQSIANAAPPPLEVIVVADGDTDGSWQVAEHWGARVIRLASSHGPAYARNRGAEVARGRVLLFLDADVTVPHDIIAQVTTRMHTEPHLAALIGSYDEHPFATNFLSQYKNLFHHYIHQTSNPDASTFWGACGAIDREAFFAVGGFDEHYHLPSIEDIELGYRLRRAGYAIRLCKTLQVTHRKCWTALSLVTADVCYRALPWTDLIWREGQIRSDLNLGTTSRASVVSVYLLLVTLVGALRWPTLIFVAVSLVLVLLALNVPVYRFFLRQRGWWFMIRALVWHWFYYGYSGGAFAIGSLRALVRYGWWKRPRVTRIVRPASS